MPENFMLAPGDLVDRAGLKVLKSLQVADAAAGHPYVKLVECRRRPENGEEVLVMDIDVETCQKPVYDIRSTERIAIHFFLDDSEPEVTALRDDFPTDVPHRKLSRSKRPVALCLYEEPYAELKLHWTPHLFLEDIRGWLARTARNEAHQSDQPLEPLLGGRPVRLVVPSNLLASPEGGEPLIIRSIDGGNGSMTLVAEWMSRTQASRQDFRSVVLVVRAEPQVHGVIHSQPATVADLHKFLSQTAVDLIGYLRRQLIELKNNESYADLLDLHVVLVACIPVMRTEGTPPENSDVWAFATNDTIKTLGVKTGVWSLQDGRIGALIIPDETKQGADAEIHMLSPVSLMSKDRAAMLNGLDRADNRHFLLVGVGALGSQLFMNLVRMGYGPWTIIDDDCLLPHNLARHALLRGHLGFSKAQMLAGEANGLIDGQQVAEALTVNVLEPSAAEKIADRYEKADIIIDASTSLAVERYLARDVSSSARRISVFLNPAGTDSVMLAEDSERRITVDCLEMQYYRALINESDLNRHLETQTGTIRYARSCRDVSLTIPQDSVALLSAVCTKGIRHATATQDPRIQIWRAGPDFAIEAISIPVYEVVEHHIGAWTLYTDGWLLQRVRQFREGRLPNETGGVLIGAHDMQRRNIYVVDMMQSPADSVEWPAAYIRGSEGLLQRVKEIRSMTANNLEYVGEWHSHPFGCSASLSEDDARALAWLQETMSSQGFPGVMLIVGNAGECSWSLAEVLQ